MRDARVGTGRGELMENGDRVLIVMPAFNEEQRIGRVIADVRRAAPFADLLVVNDGSSDGTESTAKRAGARVVSLPFNLGYGSALQTGFKYALRERYDYVVQVDADGQHEPSSVPDLVDEVRKGEADLILGSRFIGPSTFEPAFARKLGILFFRTVVSLIVRRRISDPTSGFQALNKRVLRLYATDAYPFDFPDADVLIMLHRAGFKIREIPVVMYSPTNISMHSGLRPLYYVFKMILSITVTLMRKEKLVRGA